MNNNMKEIRLVDTEDLDLENITIGNTDTKERVVVMSTEIKKEEEVINMQTDENMNNQKEWNTLNEPVSETLVIN